MRVQEYKNGVMVREYDDGTPEPPADPQAEIAELKATVAALTDQATGKITKAQLSARLDAAKPVKPGKGDEIQAAREAVE